MAFARFGVRYLVTCMTVLGLCSPLVVMAKNNLVDSKNIKIGKETLIRGNKNAKATSGPRTGGGGNTCALVISQNTDLLQKNSELMLENDIVNPTQLERLNQEIASARFYTTDKLEIDKEDKDAINFYLQNKVVVSEKFCRYIEVSGRAASILLHEYMGLAEIDDADYKKSGLFLEKYTELINQKAAIYDYVQTEVKKDLAGKKSCFKGAIRKKRNEMDNNYGGRFSPDAVPNINIAEGSSTQYRNMDKYCDDLGNGLQSCSTNDTAEYLVAIQFSASTTGTFEVESIDFRVAMASNSVLVIKETGLNPEQGGDEIVSEKVHDTYTCHPLK